MMVVTRHVRLPQLRHQPQWLISPLPVSLCTKVLFDEQKAHYKNKNTYDKSLPISWVSCCSVASVKLSQTVPISSFSMKRGNSDPLTLLCRKGCTPNLCSFLSKRFCSFDFLCFCEKFVSQLVWRVLIHSACQHFMFSCLISSNV